MHGKGHGGMIGSNSIGMLVFSLSSVSIQCGMLRLSRLTRSLWCSVFRTRSSAVAQLPCHTVRLIRGTLLNSLWLLVQTRQFASRVIDECASRVSSLSAMLSACLWRCAQLILPDCHPQLIKLTATLYGQSPSHLQHR